MEAVGAARFLASVHIVAGHLFAKGELPNVYLFSWGFTWVPWFFMLSGFVLTHARLVSKDPEATEPTLTYLWKRTSGVYPMYAWGMLLAAVDKVRIGRENFPAPWKLGLQCVMAHAWIPQVTEKTILTHSWFLSALVVFWLLFAPMYARIRRLSVSGALATLAAACAIPWAAMPILMAHQPHHVFGRMASNEDLIVVMLKFHPACYLHVFVAGMALARLRQHLRENPDAPGAGSSFLSALRAVGTPLGYLGLAAVFLVPALRPGAAKLTARLSVLMPLQAALLFGLSFAQDPISRVLALAPAATGDVSYAQYIVQFVAMNVYGSSKYSPAFFVFLAACAYASATLVTKRGRKLWMDGGRWSLVAGPALLALGLLFVGVVGGQKEDFHPTLPAYRLVDVGTVQTAERPFGNDRVSSLLGESAFLSPSESAPLKSGRFAIDARLNFTTPGGSDAAALADMFVINPSLSFGRSGRAVRAAARAHLKSDPVFSEGSRLGRPVTEVTTTYLSAILLGEAGMPAGWERAWEEASRGASGADAWPGLPEIALRDIGPRLKARAGGKTLLGRAMRSKPWAPLCRPEGVFVAENNTVVRKVVTGPEDPTLAPTFEDAPPEPLHYAPEDEAGDAAGPGGDAAAAFSFSSLLPEARRSAFGGNNPRTLRRAAASADDEDEGSDEGSNEGSDDSDISAATKCVSRMHVAREPRGGVGFDAFAADSNVYPATLACQGHYAHYGGYQTFDYFFGKYRETGDQKNWGQFEWRGELMYVYSVLPHRVVQARVSDGACVERRNWHTMYPALQWMWSQPDASDDARVALRVHGSGAAVRVEGGLRGDDPGAAPYHLGLFHVKGDADDAYTTFAYAFAAEPPFEILRVAKDPLPLDPLSFATGVHVVRGFVLVTYGRADADARVLAMTVDDFEATFEGRVADASDAEEEAGGGGGGGDDDDDEVVVNTPVMIEPPVDSAGDGSGAAPAFHN